MRKFNRHAVYYRLMDFCLAMYVVNALHYLASGYFNQDLLPDLLLSIGRNLTLVAFLLSAFLVFARFMRDDFSEQLWQKTAGTVLKALIVLPLPAALIAGYAILEGDATWTSAGHRDFAEILSVDPARVAQMDGVIRSIIYLWLATPMLFIFTFQWHRWRASR